MEPLTTTALIGAGSGLATDLFNAFSTNRANKRAYRQTVDLWNMNNQYNHPSAQMARLREAGLNPNLVYGSGVKGATGASSNPGSPPVEAPQLSNNPIATYQNIKNSELQTDNMRAQNDLLNNKKVLDLMEMASKNEDLKKKRIYNDRYQEILDLKVLEAQNQERMSSIKASFSERDWALYRNNQVLFNQAILDAQRIKSENLSNAQKLGKLRELQADIQESIKNFKDANEVTKLLYPILLSIIK